MFGGDDTENASCRFLRRVLRDFKRSVVAAAAAVRLLIVMKSAQISVDRWPSQRRKRATGRLVKAYAGCRIS